MKMLVITLHGDIQTLVQFGDIFKAFLTASIHFLIFYGKQ